MQVKQVYSKLLESKQERWTAQQAALKSSITGLAKFFTALQSLPSEGSPPDFSVWFEHLHQQVRAALHSRVSFPTKGFLLSQDWRKSSLRLLSPLPESNFAVLQQLRVCIVLVGLWRSPHSGRYETGTRSVHQPVTHECLPVM